MASPVSIRKHPLHRMLVAVPIGLWIFALVCDVIAVAGATGPWSTVAFYCVAGGIAGAVITAAPGLIDYFSIDEAQMRRIATYHLESTLVLCWFSRPICGFVLRCPQRASCRLSSRSSESWGLA